MKTTTKVLIGVGAAAVVGGVIFLYMKGKKVAEPDYTTDSTAPGFQLKSFAVPPKTQAASINASVVRSSNTIPFIQPPMPPLR